MFYSQEITQDILHLNKEDSRHCITVLRKKAGDTIQIVDGKGGVYTVQITLANPKKCAFEIVEKIEKERSPKQHLHLAIAPTKNINRFEWFLEKATEIGISEITPILTYHSERKVIKLERLNKIVLAAMKQSERAYLPQLNELRTWKQFLQEETSPDTYKAIACMTEKSTHLFNNYSGGNALILIGPEGGFSLQEIEEAQAQHFQTVTLGSSRLRSETAGIVACQILNLKD